MSKEGKKKNLTPAEQEQQFLESAGEIMEKSAAAAAGVPARLEFSPDEPSRLEDRPDPPEEDEDEEQLTSTQATWGSRPSVRNQARELPDTIRLVEPETKILNLADPEQLAEYNRIQKLASDPEAPAYAITDLERQAYEGSWTAIITFQKIQYQQL